MNLDRTRLAAPVWQEGWGSALAMAFQAKSPAVHRLPCCSLWLEKVVCLLEPSPFAGACEAEVPVFLTRFTQDKLESEGHLHLCAWGRTGHNFTLTLFCVSQTTDVVVGPLSKLTSSICVCHPEKSVSVVQNASPSGHWFSWTLSPHSSVALPSLIPLLCLSRSPSG